MILRRASTALARLSPRRRDVPAAAEVPTSPQELAELREELRRNQKALARLRKRLQSLEEEVGETRRLGLQVGQLGDLVTTLLARHASDSDDAFSRNLSNYADDL